MLQAGWLVGFGQHPIYLFIPSWRCVVVVVVYSFLTELRKKITTAIAYIWQYFWTSCLCPADLNSGQTCVLFISFPGTTVPECEARCERQPFQGGQSHYPQRRTSGSALPRNWRLRRQSPGHLKAWSKTAAFRAVNDYEKSVYAGTLDVEKIEMSFSEPSAFAPAM